jgi:hypothetical protein
MTSLERFEKRLWKHILALVFMLLFLSGCISKAEHKSFVEASRAYFDTVAPVYSHAIETDAALSEQSKRNRLGIQKDYATALQLAEERVK